MAPSDLLRPLEGQRDETLRLLDNLTEEDLDAVDEDSGWTVRRIFAHLARSELGQAFLIRLASEGELVHLTAEERDRFNDEDTERASRWDLDQLRRELAEARGTLQEVFASLDEEIIDRAIRWPEWPARTIRTSIPYMLEHEDSHIDQIKKALRV